jgi:hypothetical protein
MKIIILTLAILSSVISFEATSEIFKCTNDQGKITFQETACDTESGNVVGTKIQQKTTKKHFGIHSSWFDKPLYSVETARCTETGCICGDNNHTYSQRVKSRVMRALRNLHSKWNSHERAVERQRRSNASFRNNSSKKNLLRASCEVSISQETLKLYYEVVAAKVISDYETASKTLQNIESRCPTVSGELKCSKELRKKHRAAKRTKSRNSSDYFSLMQELKRLERPRI